jgi:hypothetical protein
VYAFGQLWPTSSDAESAQEQAFELTAGTRVKQRQGPIDYRLETGVQLGSRPADAGAARKALAYHAEAEVGAYLLADAIRTAIGGFYASGDDPDTMRNEGWNQLFPTAHKFLGVADIIGARTNITGGLARASYRLSSKLVLAADGHLFVRPHGADGTSTYAGTELDTGAAYTVGGGLKLRGGYSLFLPSKSQYGSSTPAHFAELELRYDLK